MNTFQYQKGQALFERAKAVIPTGIPGHLSRRNLNFPDAFPAYGASARGARFTDVDGNEFIDYVCAYGPVILGYNDETVTEAAVAQLRQFTVMSAVPANMVDLAELLVDTVTAADWAFFCKNGADVTALAVLVARAATGRKKVVLVDGGYHGSAPWMQPANSAGVLEDDVRNVIYIPWNDVQAFQRVVDENPRDIAAFMAAPYYQPLFGDDVLPEDGYWPSIQAICNKEGIVLVTDDVRCGFRLDLRGSNEYFGYKPDLICFSKAIANGYPLSALVGKESMKEAIASVRAVGTFWYEATAFAAAVATLTKLRETDAAATVLEKGARVTSALRRAAREQGFELALTGAPSMFTVRIEGDDSRLTLTSEWSAECVKRGAYILTHHNNFVTLAHSDEDIARTAEIAGEAFAALGRRRAVVSV